MMPPALSCDLLIVCSRHTSAPITVKHPSVLFCPLHNKLSSFEVFSTSWSILCELPPILQREIPISGSLFGHHHQTEEELLGYFGGASPSYIHGHP